MINAAQAQLIGQLVGADGAPTSVGRALDAADAAFTCVFAAELSLNAGAHWFQPFVRNPYNAIDTAVVLLSLASLGPLNVPASILRVLRAFRVVRIFGRLRSLKNIITALAMSVSPVANAFILMLLVIAICECQSSLSPIIPITLDCNRQGG